MSHKDHDVIQLKGLHVTPRHLHHVLLTKDHCLWKFNVNLSFTLDSGINEVPGITVVPPSYKFSHHDFITFLHQSRHCGHFLLFFLQNFTKINYKIYQ